MAKAQYTEEQFKDFGDFYAYTDVFDWHYVNILEWKNGIALAELERKISTSSDERKVKLYKAILKVLQSKQYLVQKKVMLNTRFFEQCIDFWPAMFDGIECKVDDNGNGIPDDEENGADYFEVSKPKATKK